MPEYRVSGPFPFGDHAPDSTFKAAPDERIERALRRGSISPAAEVPETTDADVVDESAETTEPSADSAVTPEPESPETETPPEAPSSLTLRRPRCRPPQKE